MNQSEWMTTKELDAEMAELKTQPQNAHLFTADDVEILDETPATCLAPDCGRRYYVILSHARNASEYCSVLCEVSHADEIAGEPEDTTAAQDAPCGCPVRKMAGFLVTTHRDECQEGPFRVCGGCGHDVYAGEHEEHAECGQA